MNNFDGADIQAICLFGSTLDFFHFTSTRICLKLNICIYGDWPNSYAASFTNICVA